MTIRINQIAVAFTLENEKTIADLTTAFRSWAEAQDLAILGIMADGHARAPDDKTPLESFAVIDIEAVPVGERDLARVAVLSRFFSLLAQGWSQNNQILISELHGEFASIKTALFPLLDPLARRISQSLMVLENPWTDPVAQTEATQTLAAELETRRKELQDPRVALTETLSDLDRSLDNLADLGTLFQRGQDKDGYGRILNLFTVLEDLGRRSELAFKEREIDDRSWVEFQTDLKPVLQETESALAAGDLILVTDLLEYEVTPRLRQILDFFPELSNLDRATSVL